jgi:putative Mg2+ transporter-C (MgtC) family protein
MSIHEQIEALIPITVALLLSGLIGLDREWRHRPAGLRTHMLVGLASALVTVLARGLYGADASSRILANVIVGIGFLGAGVIIRGEHQVHELTTAASIWLVAIIGMTTGARLYVLAAGATGLGWFVLTILRLVTKRLIPPHEAN